MASPPVLEVDRLIAPIPGDKPAGIPPTFDLVRQLDDARKEGDPFGPPRKQDWPAIVRLTTEALAGSSKDMLVAARLTEGATQMKGFAGLRDSLTLLTRLLTDCWDRLYPVPEDGEGMDVRGGPLLWLNDVARGARFPYTLTNVALIEVRGENFSHVDWRGTRRPEFEASLGGVNPAKVRDLSDDVTAARSELEKLAKVVDERMPELGINLVAGSGTIGTALTDVAETVAELMQLLGLNDKPEENSDESANPEAAAGGAANSAAGGKSMGATRTDLYRQLDGIADALQRLEPHSPIPFLIKRAVRLGALPFPQLMRAMIEESGALDQLDRLLGIQKPDDE